MTPREQVLLALILTETRRVEGLSPYRDNADQHEWGERYGAILDLPEYGVRINTAWLGDDPAGRQARRRTLISLEKRGFIEVFAKWYGRPTHAKLTASGRAAAEKLGEGNGNG